MSFPKMKQAHTCSLTSSSLYGHIPVDLLEHSRDSSVMEAQSGAFDYIQNGALGYSMHMLIMGFAYTDKRFRDNTSPQVQVRDRHYLIFTFLPTQDTL